MWFSRKYLVSLLFVLSLAVTACSGSAEGKDSGGSALEGANNEGKVPTATIPAETEDDTSAPANEEMSASTARESVGNPWGLEDTLIYTQNDTLYVWNFAEHAEPQAMAYDVDEHNVNYAPERNSVLFGAWRGSSFFLNSLDLANYEINQLIEVGRSHAPGREVSWSAWSWSPDGQWFILRAWDFDIPMGIVAADGTGYIIKIEESIFDAIWTTDNELILVIVDFSAMDMDDEIPVNQISELIKIDPKTDGRVDISSEIDIEMLNNTTDYNEQFQLLYQGLADAGFVPIYFAPPPTDEEDPEEVVESETFYYVQSPEGMYDRDFNAPPVYCQEWNILKWDTADGISPYAQDVDTSRTEILYSDNETVTITNLINLADESVLFLRVYYPNCEYGTPIGELIHMQPDGQYEVLSEKLVHAGDTSLLRGWLQGTRFVVDPDLTHVVWIESDGIGLHNNLQVTDLTTDTSEALTVDGQLIEDVVSLFWFETSLDTETLE